MALSKIKTNSIEDDAVTATQIAADAVGTSEIAANASSCTPQWCFFL